MNHATRGAWMMCTIRIAVCCVLFNACLCRPSAAQDNTKGIGVREVQAALESVPATEKPPKRFALIVAAGDYQDAQIPDLPQCTQDGKVIQELLSDPQKGMFPPENVVLLTGDKVTREKVIGELESLATRIGKDDLVVVYFSGHGATDSQSRAYWVMQNTSLSSLRATALPELDVTELLDGLPTSRLLVLIDACYSAATANLKTKSVVDPARLYPKFDGNGRVAITASNGQQLSLVIDDPRHPGHGHSVFTWHLKEAMNGAADVDRDGVFTVAEVWQHLTDHVPVTAKQLHGEMTPQLKGQFGGRFLLSIDAAQLTRRMTIHDELVGKRKERLAILKEMALADRMAVEHFKEAQLLMALDPDNMSSEQVDLLSEYIAVIEGKLPPEKLPRALELARTTPSVVAPRATPVVPTAPVNPPAYSPTAPVPSAGKVPDPLTTDVPIFQGIEGAKAGDVRKITLPNGQSLRIVWCPAGRFRMGSQPGEAHAKPDEQPPVDVELTGFWIGETEVTQSQWSALLASHPWEGQEGALVWDDLPATYVDWNASFEFCRELSRLEQTAGRLPTGWAYRLPTEAQWEYACRAGSSTAYFFGDDSSQLPDYAWIASNSTQGNARSVQMVALKKKNPWGLYDMHGNANEWTACPYSNRLIGGKDPSGAVSSPYRVSRGGSAASAAEGTCRSSRRYGSKPTDKSGFVGFRVVLGPNRKTVAPEIAHQRPHVPQQPQGHYPPNQIPPHQYPQDQFYYEDDNYVDHDGHGDDHSNHGHDSGGTVEDKIGNFLQDLGVGNGDDDGEMQDNGGDFFESNGDDDGQMQDDGGGGFFGGDCGSQAP